MPLDDHLPPNEPAAAGALNPSMLDLFRVDAEGQLQVLDTGLLALKRRSMATEIIEPCICAANSLRDAADMVGLRLGAIVAGALEDCFVALQRRRISVRPPTLEVLTRGYDLLSRIARSRNATDTQWMGAQHPQVDAFVADARALCQNRDTPPTGQVPALASLPGRAPAGATPPPASPAIAAVAAAVAAATSPPTRTVLSMATPVATKVSLTLAPPRVTPNTSSFITPVTTSVPRPPVPSAAPAPPAPAPPKPGTPAADPRARFCREAEILAENLTTDLLELQPDPSARGLLESGITQARALVAAARDIELAPAMILAQELEDCLTVASDGSLSLRPSAIDVLLRGVDLYVRFARTLKENANRIDDHQPELRLFLAAVKCICDAGEVTLPVRAESSAIEPMSVELPAELAGPVPATRPASTTAALEWDVVAETLASAPTPPAPSAEEEEEQVTEIVVMKTTAELVAEAQAADESSDQITEIIQLKTMAELRSDPAPLLPPLPAPILAPRNDSHTAFEAKLEVDSDATLLELFQIEAERLIQDLAGALLALQRNPNAPEMLEPCMRACQSLKGATRMIGLPVGVSLSHALLEVFMSAQEGRIHLQQSGIGLLLQSADVLASIARQPEAEFGRWGSELGAEIEVFLAALKRLRDGANDLDAAAALGLTPAETSAAAVQTQADNQPVATPPLADADRLTLLELFHGEGESLAQALLAGLSALQMDPLAPEHLEACMRAAHSFKGASRIVGLNMGVSLARALEECFVSAQHGRITLRASSITVLLRGADLLGRMARTEEADFSQWSGKRRAEVELIVAALKRVSEKTNTSEQLLTRVRASLARAG